jgi:hypothetical protein
MDSLAATPFYLAGGTTDAFNNKTGAIYRTGNIGIGNNNPVYNLDITGKARLTDSLYGTTARFNALTTGANTDSVVTVDASGNLRKRSATLYGDTTTLSNTYWNLSGNAVTALKKLGTTTNFDLPIYTNDIERIRVKNNGNVGIGNSNPTSILDVQAAGSGNYTSVGKFMAPNNTTPGNATQLNFGAVMSPGNNVEWRFIYQGNGAPNNRMDFGFNGNNAAMLSVLANGKVGVGNGNPSAKFDVVGTGKFSDTLFGTRAQFSSLTTGANTDSVVTIDASGYLKKRTLSSILNEPWFKAGTTTGATNNTDNIYITGNVGIGTSNPSAILDVESSGTTTYTSVGKFMAPLNTTAGNITQMNFGTTMSRGNNAEFRFVYQGDNATNNRVDFGFNDYVPPVLSYLVNGNVGIGEGNPANKLHVMGTGKFTDTLFGTRAQFNILTSGANTDSVVTIDASGNLRKRSATLYGDTTTLSNTYWNLSGNAVTTQKILGTTTNFDLPIITNNTERIRVKNNGNVGIGTATPAAKLDVADTIAGATAITGINLSGDINDFFQYNIRNKNSGVKAQSGYNAISNNGTDTTNFVWMGINNSAFNNPQKYNIGGANDVSYVGSGNDMYIANANTSRSIIFSRGKATAPFFDESMRITNAGKVGIGTATPITTLHVENPLQATTYANADAQVLRLSRPTLPGLKWDNIAQFNLGSYSTAIAAQSRLDLALTNGGNAVDLTNVMTWQANGNVGIGTTAPTKTLDVNGELRIRTATAGSIYTDSLLVADATGVVKKAKYITPGVKNLDGAFSTYTIALSDMGGIIIVNSSIDVTITVPLTLPAGFTTQIIQKGTGKVTMVNAVGLTLSSANGYNTRAQFSAIGVVMASSTEGYITGDSSNL